MRDGGTPILRERREAVTRLDANHGSRYAIGFNPMGWTTQAGKTYMVAVTNIPTAINYAVQIVDCP